MKTCRRTSSHKVTTVLVGTRGKPEKRERGKRERERKRKRKRERKRKRKSGQLQNKYCFKNNIFELKKKYKKDALVGTDLLRLL